MPRRWTVVAWSIHIAVSLLTVYACVGGPTNAACIPGTYSVARWPPSYWVQPLPELEETLAQVPPGAFVLVRSSKGVEAIRFLDVMAAASEGDAYGCASYEVYRLPQRGKSESRPTHAGHVSAFRIRGVHPFGYQPGQDRLQGATGSLRYNYPTQIVVGKANEVAVSAWTSIVDVDPTSQRLRWFRNNQDGTRTSKAVEFTRAELP